MIKEIPGIYKIESIIKPERFYIGSSYSVLKRKNYHFEDLHLNKHRCTKLQNHYNKYGEDDLFFSIVEKCNVEDLIIREQYYIDNLNPWFNICRIAGSPRGIKHSEKSKHNMSLAHIGKPSNISPEQRILARERMLGTKYALGNKLSEETKAKMSKSKMNHYVSEETKQKLRNAWKNRPPMSEENRNKLRVKRSEETKKHMSEIWYNRNPLREETKEIFRERLKVIREKIKLDPNKRYSYSKKVINIETNEIFYSVKDAAKSIGWSYDKLHYNLKKENNITNFRYYYG